MMEKLQVVGASDKVDVYKNNQNDWSTNELEEDNKDSDYNIEDNNSCNRTYNNELNK